MTGYVETTNRVTFRVRTDPAGSGALLVASLTQDGGWRAHDESGERIAVGRANGPFLAIFVPGGDHRVRLDYSPPGSRSGGGISLVSLLFAVLLAARTARHHAGRT